VSPAVIPSKFFVVDANKFRKGVGKIVQVSIRYAVPWYEYMPVWGGLVKKLECNLRIDEAKVRSVSVCKEVDRAKEFLLLPILIIEASKGVLTIVTVD
jgi:hypothetical protein